MIQPRPRLRERTTSPKDTVTYFVAYLSRKSFMGPDNRGCVTLTDVTKRRGTHATPLETGNCSAGVRSYVPLCNVWRMRLMSGWEMTAEPPAF